MYLRVNSCKNDLFLEVGLRLYKVIIIFYDLKINLKIPLFSIKLLH